jgi:hypothetical protein
MNFYKDVICKHKKFNSVEMCKDLALLEPVFREQVKAIIADLAKRGIKVIIGETYRSKTRQALLFAKGVTKLKDVGVHHFGLACDLWIMHNGQPDFEADYTVFGAPIKAQKLIWGNDWGTPKAPHSFRDIDHVQRCAVTDQAKLFAGTWYPAATYSPL